MRVARIWCRGNGGHGKKRWGWGWWTLIALGEKAEGVDLVDEVGHAGPTPQPEPHHQHPPDHERVHHVSADPPSDEPRRPLHCALHCHTSIRNHVTSACRLPTFLITLRDMFIHLPINNELISYNIFFP